MPFLWSCLPLSSSRNPPRGLGPRRPSPSSRLCFCVLARVSGPVRNNLIRTAVIRIRAQLGTIDTSASIAVLVLSVAVLGSFICTLVLWPNSNSNTFLAPSVHGVPLLGWPLPHRMGRALRTLLWTVEDPLDSAGPCRGIHLERDPVGDHRRSSCGLLDARCGRHIDCGAPASAPRRLDGQTQRHGSPHLVDQIVAGSGQGSHRVLLALLIVPTVCALRWSTVLGDFRQTVTQHQGVVSSAEVPPSPGSSYLWSWTNPTLSLLLRSSSSNAIVENMTTGFTPFSVDSAEHQIPPAYRWSS